jgi:hypothetical protein
MRDKLEKCISSRGDRLARASVSKDQPATFPHVIADANFHNVHRLGTIDCVGIVFAVNPVSDADIAAMVEQLD